MAMDAARKFCTRWADYFNCRLMPHGGPVLLPVVLSTLALASSLADDGCDYATVRGAAVEMLTGSNAVPYVHAGMEAYRVPGYYPTSNAWRVAYGDECVPYERRDLLTDTSWAAAEWLRFFALVAGGSTATFLWTSTCLALRPNYWRAAGAGAGLACILQTCSFVWFYTKLCHTSTTNFYDFEAGREEVEMSAAEDAVAFDSPELSPFESSSSECGLFFGSKCAIASTVIWGAASAAILLRRYPVPVPKLVAIEENVAMMIRKQPCSMNPMKSGHGGGGPSMRKGGIGTKNNQTQRSSELTASLSTAGGQSYHRSSWVSGGPAAVALPPAPGGNGNSARDPRGAAPLSRAPPPLPHPHHHHHFPANNNNNNNINNNVSMSAKFSGSAFSAGSFV